MITAMSDASAPPVPGFVESTFSPLVHAAVHRCLGAAPPGDGARTAIVLASTVGDATTLDTGSRSLVAGQAHQPLLFMQSTANAILGRLAVDLAVTGPLLSLSTAVPGGIAGELLTTGALLLETGEADRVVLVGVELAAGDRAAAAHRALGTVPPAEDLAVALLLDRDDPVPHLPELPAHPPPAAPPDGYGTLRGLVALAARNQGTPP
ncbi:hypothetical protein [Streptomyces silvensis]|uniref:Beta-ketoacyl synthase N-terminal domain-containing protein n=1 Tax=Streptomyces silvensis TaxID=1765722 RepID=A0A0W7X228_9ACTN|nr:hypothetical protein [Streptomyces silvensis]KUF16799.1 hypothetical protein AT728_23060 [Streptomyces silvensis]